MSESAGLPKKSNMGLVLLGLLLLVGAGGALFWKLSQGSGEEIVEETLGQKPASDEPPALDEAPPPPPPEEELADADKKDEPTTAASTVKSSGPAGCSGACTGTAGAELQSALRARGGQARGCYQRALRLNSTLEGKMTVALKLSPTGAVCGASISGDTLNDAAVSTCVLQNFRSGKYPAPQGGCVETAIPLNFVAKQ